MNFLVPAHPKTLRHPVVRGLLALWLIASGTPTFAAAVELPAIGGASGAEHHPGKIIWADLITPDLAMAEQFYGGMFGWTFKDVATAHKDYALAYSAGQPVGGILQRTVPGGEHRQSAWLTFLAVSDVDAARRSALKAGAKSVSDPKTYRGRGRQAVLSDPDGAVFAILASSSGDPADYLARPGEWIWSALLVPDPSRSAAFYQNLFGYEMFDVASDDGAEHVIFSSDNYARASANTLPSGPLRRRAHWLNFIRVVDVAQAVDKAVSLGGRTLVGPHEDHEGGMAAVVADPGGAPLGLMQWSDTTSKEESK